MSDLISRSELLKKFDDTGIQITFNLPVEEILGEYVDIDDFTMLLQDAIQEYKKMVIDTIKNQPTFCDIDKVVPVATIKFDKEDMKELVDKKVEEIELDIQKIRNEAIDDYTNKLCNHCMQQNNECYMLECPFCTDCCEIVNIAEQLKEGRENDTKRIM